MSYSVSFILLIILLTLFKFIEANESFVSIDLGSDKLSIAVYHQNQIQLVQNTNKNLNYPNILSVDKEIILFGDEALNHSYTYPERMIYDIKRIIGKEYKDIASQVYIKHWNHKIINLENKAYIEVQLNETTVQLFTPEELFTETLLKIREKISLKFQNTTFEKLVITIPSSFNNFQRESIIGSSKQSGFKSIYLISNPLAIILGYINDLTIEIIKPKIFFLVDFGSINIDIAIIQVNPDVKGKSYSINLIGSYSNNDFGGSDFDNNILDYYINKIRSMYNKCIENNLAVKYKLRREITRVKKELSEKYVTDIELDNLYEGIDFKVKVSRAEFEVINEELFRRINEIINKVFIDTKMNREQIDKIILSGGSSNIVKFRELIKGYFLNKEIIYLTEIKSNKNSEFNVIGAALYGNIIINKNDSKFIFTNTIPYSIGTDQTDDLMDVIIQKNTPVPISTKRTYTTGEDNQKLITISIFQGENKLINDNTFLIEYIINDLPPVKAGIINIEVEFIVDINGILSIKARELLFNLTLHITSSNKYLTSVDIYRIIHEQEELEKEKLKKIEDQKKRNEIIEYSYYVNRTIKSITTLCIDDKYLLEKRILKTIQWFDANINNNDLEEYERKKTELKITEQTIKALSEYVCQDSINKKTNTKGNNNEKEEKIDNSSLKDIKKILFRIDSNYKTKLKKLDATTNELKTLQHTLFKLINDYSNYSIITNQTDKLNEQNVIKNINPTKTKEKDDDIVNIKKQLDELQFTIPIMMNELVYPVIMFVVVLICFNLFCFAFIYFRKVPSTEEIVKELNESFTKAKSPKSTIRRRSIISSITPIPSSTKKSPHLQFKNTPQKEERYKDDHNFAVPNPNTIKKVKKESKGKKFVNGIVVNENCFYSDFEESPFSTPLTNNTVSRRVSESNSICGDDGDIVCFENNNKEEIVKGNELALIDSNYVIENETFLQKLKKNCDSLKFIITFRSDISYRDLLVVIITFFFTLFILIQLGFY